MASTTKEIVAEIPTRLRVYSDGTVERLQKIQIVAPSLDDPKTRPVSSKDVVFSQNPLVSARLFLPKSIQQKETENKRIPILVYFHGGGFVSESAFSPAYDTHFKELVSQVEIIVVSVEYRLAPEHPLPDSYHDCWAALQWVCSHCSTVDVKETDIDTDTNVYDDKTQISRHDKICSIYDTTPFFKYPENSTNREPWLIELGDLHRVFIGGDSAGGNIVHNIAMRAGSEALHGGVRIRGAIYSHPFFYSSEIIESIPETWKGKNYYVLTWNLVCPSAPGGIDNPMINPVGPGAPSLTGLGCSKVLVCVAGKDNLRERGVWYYEAVRKSGWIGKLELFEEEEEDHVYHIYHPESENSKKLIKRLAAFLLDE